jgi:hypothetical protein
MWSFRSVATQPIALPLPYCPPESPCVVDPQLTDEECHAESL